MNSPESLPASYFDAIYQAEPDPWKFATSEYEAQKYAATIAALPKTSLPLCVRNRRLDRCTHRKNSPQSAITLLSIDVAKLAQDQAIARCQQLPHVSFELMSFPHQYPQTKFDLILVSEVAYYWCPADLQTAQQRILELLEPGGNLLLVHWLPRSPDYPLTGDEVHESFLEFAPPQLRHIQADRNEKISARPVWKKSNLSSSSLERE